MSADKRWRLICYDVRDPRRYRRLHKVMKGMGRPVQYSVFRCRLDDLQLERLQWRLAQILDPSDRLLVVDLCPSCAERVVSRNHVDGWTVAAPAFAFVTKQAPLADEPEEVGVESKSAILQATMATDRKARA